VEQTPVSDAQIVLAYSQDSGIVAFVHGEEYRRARAALDASAFERGESGVYQLSSAAPDTVRATVAEVLRLAGEHGVRVSTSSRRFIGDAARDITRLLPGPWQARVELYEHPAWQQDLVPWLWDSGELARTVRIEPVPYAAVLTNPEAGTTLLLIEHPGHPRHYLLGAFTPEHFSEGHDAPHAPRSIVLPPFPTRAARMIAGQFLPVYDRAVHALRTETVAEALRLIQSGLSTWREHHAHVRSRHAGPADVAAFGAATSAFLDAAWGEFLAVVDHAPALLDRCRPASTSWPQDTRTLRLLADALHDAESVCADITDRAPSPGSEHHARAWQAIEPWLAHREAFLRQARAATPPCPPCAPAISAPLPVLPPMQRAPHR
jgi:hypothetical protein